MAQLLVRNLPESLVKKLKRRAVENGVSAEEEHRRILAEVLKVRLPRKKRKGKEYTFMDHLMAMPNVGEDWMFDRKDPRNAFPPGRPPIDFSAE